MEGAVEQRDEPGEARRPLIKEGFIERASRVISVLGARTDMEIESPPTREAWGDLEVDPEVASAYSAFGGKTIEQAMPLFLENPLERSAELRFAPAAVFNYYIFCFVKILLSPRAAGEADMASCFLRLIRDRMSAQPDQIEVVWDQLQPLLGAIAERQAFYDAAMDIYGSFAELRSEIETLHVQGHRGGA